MSAREPLAIRAAIVAAITAVVHAAVVMGWLGISPEQEGAIAGVVDLVGTVVPGSDLIIVVEYVTA